MNRCPFFSHSLATCAAIICLGITAQHSAVNAQTPVVGREFPRTALRATLVVTTPPEVLLDGKAARLSPGARLRDANNMLVMSGALAGQKLLVNFTRESTGLIHEVWLLTPEEAALKRPRATPERNFLFGSEQQTAPHDDGKTPYDQLPRLPQ